MKNADWDSLIQELPGATFLQSLEWAQIKEPVGWQPKYYQRNNENGPLQSAGMVLYRSLSILPIRIAYVPRGPLVDWSDPSQYRSVLHDLINQAKDQKAIFIKIDPDLTVGRGIPQTDSDRPDPTGIEVRNYLLGTGWLFSPDQIQFRNTVEIDLTPAEDEILMRMHQKTRYNIRLAEKKGVVVSEAVKTEWPAIYRMYGETAARDGFIIRSWDYYQRVWSILTGSKMAACLKAEVNGELVGAIWVVGFGRKAHYLYGMSNSRHREYMPNYLLQWRGMLLAKSQGRCVYDMWGAPDEFTDQDSLSGVFRFKQGFGGDVVRTLGAWDYPINPSLYRLYTSVLPKILNIMRARNRSKNRQKLSA
jgi:peptidoglycan pentaglycine glycine transferase (the first glycine)